MEVQEPLAVWGPRRWRKLHAFGADYPEAAPPAVQASAFVFFNRELRLPCHACVEHVKQHLRSHPITYAGRAALQRWLWAFHNAVNAQTGKPFFPWAAYVEAWGAAPGA